MSSFVRDRQADDSGTQYSAILMPMHYACPEGRLVLLFLTAGAVWAGNVSGTGNGGNIPPGAPAAAAGTFTSDAVIRSSGIVSSGNAVTVVLKGLQHDWSGDLIATLSYL